jgi:hypothetical protein
MTRMALILSITCSVACAAASPMAARSAPAPVVATPPPMVAPMSAAPAAAEASPGPDEVNERGAAARELEMAAQDLAASASSCALACRALGSMDRAASRLCALVVTHVDGAACSDSVSRLREARGQVRSACGSCPGGPTVDPNAPAPTP